MCIILVIGFFGLVWAFATESGSIFHALDIDFIVRSHFLLLKIDGNGVYVVNKACSNGYCIETTICASCLPMDMMAVMLRY